MSTIRYQETTLEVCNAFDAALAEYSAACTSLKMCEEITQGEAKGDTAWIDAEARRSEAAAKCREALEDILAKIAVLS